MTTCTNIWTNKGVKKLIKFVEKRGKTKGWEIARHFDLLPQDVRTLIKYIRTNTILFLGKKKYLIADSKGYSISKDMKVINKYLDKQKQTAQDMLLQVHQGLIVTKKLDKDGLVKFKEQ